jgi:hypothetical protein
VLAFGTEPLDSVVVSVGDPDVPFGTNVERRGGEEFPVPASRRAESTQEFAPGTELLQPAVAGVGHPDVSFLVDRDIGGLNELFFAGAVASEPSHRRAVGG